MAGVWGWLDVATLERGLDVAAVEDSGATVLDESVTVTLVVVAIVAVVVEGRLDPDVDDETGITMVGDEELERIKDVDDTPVIGEGDMPIIREEDMLIIGEEDIPIMEEDVDLVVEEDDVRIVDELDVHIIEDDISIMEEDGTAIIEDWTTPVLEIDDDLPIMEDPLPGAEVGRTVGDGEAETSPQLP